MANKEIFKNPIYFSLPAILITSNFAYATNTITKNTTYENTTINLNEQSILVTNNAKLTIKNSTVKATISKLNPYLITINNGSLLLQNNKFVIIAKNILPMPTDAPKYNVIKEVKGEINITKNIFSVDKAYTIGLFITENNPTNNINITDNKINNFHGGIFLINSNNANISNNDFFQVSSGNIYLKNASNCIFEKNIMEFSGNNNVGDGFDIINSKYIKLENNHIYSGSCYSIFILGGDNIIINQNSISHGITYAIYITDHIATQNLAKVYLLSLNSFYANESNDFTNKNIYISNNYISQNRYGITATNVFNLNIANNIFIQKFYTDKNRKFWTNNDILLKNIEYMTWEHNLYKEAFNQVITENNINALNYTLFPLHDGVSL